MLLEEKDLHGHKSITILNINNKKNFVHTHFEISVSIIFFSISLPPISYSDYGANSILEIVTVFDKLDIKVEAILNSNFDCAISTFKLYKYSPKYILNLFVAIISNCSLNSSESDNI